MKLKTWLPVSPTIPVGAPHEGGHGVAKGVDVLAALEKRDLADLAGGDDLFRQIVHGVAREGVADAGDDALLAGDVGQLAGLVGGIGERLFAVDVFTREKGGLCHIVMQAVGQADVDQVDFRVGHGGLPVLQDPGSWRAEGEVLRGLWVGLHQRHHAGGPATGAKEMREGLVGHGVDLAHPAGCAKDGNSYLAHGCPLPDLRGEKLRCPYSAMARCAGSPDPSRRARPRRN
nr:hypothetical protein [Sagittula salina]